MNLLKQLHVENFALIDECNLDFHCGFTAFTGETGAGKSLLIDAISLLCGERASASFVQRGKQKAVITGLFSLDNVNQDVLKELNLNTNHDLHLYREISKDGKSSIKINGKTANLQQLKAITSNLIDIHSQHDTQYLLNKNSHLLLLDKTLKDKTLRDETEQHWKAYAASKKQYEDFLNTSLTENDVDYLRFEIEEIEKAHLYVNEDEELEDRLKLIQSFEKIYGRLSESIEYFEKDGGADELLYEISSNLNQISDYDSIKKISELFKEKYYDLKDCIEQLKDLRDNQSYDEDEMNELQSRLFEIGRLKRKYGRSIQAVLDHMHKNIELLDSLENRQQTLQRLEKQMNDNYQTFLHCAEKLSELRKSAAIELEKKVVVQLRDLMLPYAQFSVDFNTFEGNSTGIDDIEFLISMNPQEILRPLKMVASGGELSRLMLGLKTIFTALQGISCVIFDEIDTGVSGAVATSIGLKMSLLSSSAQVFSVTHLAQVASCADTHVFVSKKVNEGRSVISIHELNENERIEQIATIAYGSVNEHSINAAKELYRTNQALSAK